MRKMLAVSAVASLFLVAHATNDKAALKAQVLDDRFPEMVIDIDRNLSRLGFNPGAVDGRIDNNLLKSAEKFRIQHGLPGGSVIDVDLLLATGAAIDQTASRSVTPMPRIDGPVVGDLDRQQVINPIVATPRVIDQGSQPSIIPAPPGRRYEALSPMPRVDGPVVGRLERPLTREPSINAPTLAHEAQELMKRLGYYDGAVDGIVGPKTRAAAIAFARDFSVPFRGINRGFVDALRAAVHYRTRPARSPAPAIDSRVPPGAIDRPNLPSAHAPRAIHSPPPDVDNIIWEPRNQGIRGEQLD